MKKNFFLLLLAFLVQAGRAAIVLKMYPTPVTVTGSTTTPKYHYIDAENDGVDDLYFMVEYEFGRYEIIFRDDNGQSCEAEYINNPFEGIAYNCASNFGAGGWYDDVSLAIGGSEDYQFDGKGPRYLAVRKLIEFTPYYEYVYGWVKIECAQDASEFTVYGFAYNDQLAIEENFTIRPGQGECFGAVSTSELQLPANAIIANNGKLKVSFHEPLSLRMFDVSGKQLGAYQFEGGTESYDLPQVNGIVFLKLSDGVRPKTVKLFQ